MRSVSSHATLTQTISMAAQNKADAIGITEVTKIYMMPPIGALDGRTTRASTAAALGLSRSGTAAGLQF